MKTNKMAVLIKEVSDFLHPSIKPWFVEERLILDPNQWVVPNACGLTL